MYVKKLFFGLFFMVSLFVAVLASQDNKLSSFPFSPPIPMVMSDSPLEFGTGPIPFPGVPKEYYDTSESDRKKIGYFCLPHLFALALSRGSAVKKFNAACCCAVVGGIDFYTGKEENEIQTNVFILSTLCNLLSCTFGHSKSSYFCAPSALCSGPLCAVGEGAFGVGFSFLGLTYYLGTDAERYGCHSPKMSWDWCSVFDHYDAEEAMILFMFGGSLSGLPL